MRIYPLLLSALLATTSLAAGAAESKKPAKRPKLGLVLGGGGAKAGTQLGVLKVLEEYRIPVDFVVGTSMGSFIGSLYAMGYPVSEIEKILLETDWKRIFTAQIDRNNLPNRRKEDDYNFLYKKKIGLRDGSLKMGTGIIQTQNLRTLLRELSLHVADIKNFDDFPIPYRAVSVDLANGAEVDLDHGEIPDAVRSSMSLPGIFPPVIIEGKYLVDGGPANNLPISVAQKAGMDHFIAVDVGAPYYDPAQISNFLEVVDQLTTFLTRGNVERSYALAGPKDVILRPDLTGLTTESYEKMSDAFPRGEAVARAAADKLRAFSVSEEEYAAFKKKRERTERPPVKITSIRIKSDSKFSEKFVGATIRAKPNEILDKATAAEDLESLYATDVFSSVHYDINKTPEGKELFVEAKENPDLKDYLRFGIRLYTDFNGDNTFGVAVNHTQTRLDGLGAEWRNQFQVGDAIEYLSEFYQPVEPSLHYFVAPEVRVGRQLINTYSGNSLSAQGVKAYLDLLFSVGKHFSNVAELRAGFRYELSDVNDRIGATGVSPDTFQTLRYFTRLKLDTLDNLSIPLNGMFGEAFWEQAPSGIGSEYIFKKLHGSWIGFKTFGRNTFAIGTEGGTRFGDTLFATEQYTLGGFLRLSGSGRDGMYGQHEVLFRGIAYHQIGEGYRAIKSIPVYVGASFESGNTWAQGEDVSLDSMVLAGSGFIALDTMIGPIIAGGGYNSDHSKAAYLQIGKWF